MFLKQTRIRWNKLLRIGLILFAIFLFVPQDGAAEAAETVTKGMAEVGENMVAEAHRRRLSGGKWVSKNGRLRYKKKNGKYVKDTWCVIGGEVYYFDCRGYAKTGGFRYDCRWYYADGKGRLYVKRLRKTGSKIYYYDETGIRVWARWETIGKKKYYFDRNGAMVKNCWVGNRYVGSDGAMVRNRTVEGRKINGSGKVQAFSEKDKYIFVGASRTVDMSVAVNSSKTIFIAKAGQGYYWLKNRACRQLAVYLDKYPKCKVVFNLGNNDLWNIKKYIALYKELMEKYPKTKFYFLDALPATGAKAWKNTKRQSFNKKMKAAFGSRCIGGYSYLMSTGFSTVDGMHYPHSVSRRIYNYAIRKIS